MAKGASSILSLPKVQPSWRPQPMPRRSSRDTLQLQGSRLYTFSMYVTAIAYSAVGQASPSALYVPALWSSPSCTPSSRVVPMRGFISPPVFPLHWSQSDSVPARGRPWQRSSHSPTFDGRRDDPIPLSQQYHKNQRHLLLHVHRPPASL